MKGVIPRTQPRSGALDTDQVIRGTLRRGRDGEKKEKDQRRREARRRKSPRQLDGLPGSTFHSSNEKITKETCHFNGSPVSVVFLPLSRPLFRILSLDYYDNLLRSLTYIDKSCPEAYYIEFIFKEERKGKIV